MKAYLLSFTLLLTLSACGHRADEKFKAVNLNLPAPVEKADNDVVEKDVSLLESQATAKKPAGNSGFGYSSTGTDQVRDTTSKKIIKNGTIQFETADINATRKKILQALKKYGGYVDEDNQSTNSDVGRKEYHLKISIPAKHFDFLVDSVSASADRIDTKNISITDVTTQYIDMKTRLDNKKILENRYLELLKKGTKMSDLLQIEDKLTEIRSDIESSQGQLNYLNKQVAYSSLDITFYTQHVEKADKGTGLGYQFKKALGDGWTCLQILFFGVISIWPLLIIAGIIFWMYKVWRKKKRVKQVEE